VRLSVRIAKRLIDMTGSMAGLALTFPLFPLVGMAIRADSPGPVFYRQRRAGKLRFADGRRFEFEEFEIIKFRTMCDDAERETGAVLASKNDPRVTRVGRFLRKTRIDELPQLWNVLTGSMSLVGPRPERPEILSNVAAAVPFFEERMRDVKPGVTGLAQISLEYTGKPRAGSELAEHIRALTNPFDLEGTDGALADDLRFKLLADVAYTATLEDFWAFLRMELRILIQTPLVMVSGWGH
jgi:lipopolysaccharide/colanic/teichoic acid biosynthesis glycosyltransferase